MSYNIVNRHNLHTLSLAIKLEISNAAFIAIDTEFSGLGDAQKTRHQNIETRYDYCRELVGKHAVVALGLSIFKRKGNGYQVSNFHFVMLSLQSHMISPQSVTFLGQHGFDFNDQYKNGIPYMPGNDIVMEKNDIQCNTIFRSIMDAVMLNDCIFHNGFLDIMFIYHSFYAQLPKSFPTFIADLSGMFHGIYDTKLHESETSDGVNRLICEIRKPIAYTHTLIELELHEMGLVEKTKKKPVNTGKPYCEQYANHGYCQNGFKCEKSHDLDFILDQLEPLPHPKKSKTNITKPHEEGGVSVGTFEQKHSAAYDAYMTGYVYAHYLSLGIEDAKNKVYLIGKQIPLMINKSKYAEYSEQYMKKRSNKV